MNNSTNFEEEITLKDLILSIKKYWNLLWRNCWIIGVFCLPFLAFFIYKSITFTPVYNAEIRYIVEGDGGGGSGLGGLLGQFGISRGGGKTNPKQIIEVAKSKRLAKEVLFENEDGKNSFLANDIINVYQLTEKWKEGYPEIENFQFEKTRLENFSKKERFAFNGVYKKLVGSAKSKVKGLVNVSYIEDKGVYTINTATESEKLSIDIAGRMYDQVKYFFEERMLEDKIKSRDLLKEKSDSIKYLINLKAQRLAEFEDQNRGLVLNSKKTLKQTLAVEIQGLTSAYSESIKNFEISDYSLKQSKPLFLQIDKTLSPIRPEKESLVKNILMALILGGFLGTIFVIGRHMIQEALNG